MGHPPPASPATVPPQRWIAGLRAPNTHKESALGHYTDPGETHIITLVKLAQNKTSH